MSGEGFLSRWSKRKQEVERREVEREQEVARETVAPAADTPPEVIVESIEPHDAELHDPEAITPEELAALPPVEEIINPADFSQYLRKGVPHILRNAAMRRMWLLDPAVRDYVDPALDYAYDWNIPGGVPGNGALAAGFDAKGAAEKFFSTMRGKISSETGEFAEAEEEVLEPCDKVPHEEEALTSTMPDDSVHAEPARAEEAGKNFEDDISKNTERDTTLVERGDAATPSPTKKTQAVEAPARRHGRALPV
jgi:hypothetical protein